MESRIHTISIWRILHLLFFRWAFIPAWLLVLSYVIYITINHPQPMMVYLVLLLFAGITLFLIDRLFNCVTTVWVNDASVRYRKTWKGPVIPASAITGVKRGYSYTGAAINRRRFWDPFYAGFVGEYATHWIEYRDARGRPARIRIDTTLSDYDLLVSGIYRIIDGNKKEAIS